MEYLMTYGWSILIIAVVLGALAYLGVFNPLYFAPKANSGSCQVFRPNGAGTSYDINLLGVCNGEIPQYVASFVGGNSISGSGSGVEMSNPMAVNTANAGYTVSAWVYVSDANSNNARTIFKGVEDAYSYFGLSINPSGICAWHDGICGFTGAEVANYKWYNIVGTWPAGYGISYIYIDGSYAGQTSAGGNAIIDSQPEIGSISDVNNYNTSFQGYMSNIQIYNTSFGQNSIMALYQEGIGGAPIDLQNLVGWWPLNGNANDYSGNGNNGVPTNVVYTSSWISSYNPP